MANEYDLFYDWEIEQWHEIDAYISANDPYRHMLSNHNCFLEYDYGRDAITHVSVQTGVLSRVATALTEKSFWRTISKRRSSRIKRFSGGRREEN